MPRQSKHRNLYLIGRLEDPLARELIAEILDNPDTEFTLFINSDGGSVYNEIALCNAVQTHGRVDTVCIGSALSAAASILSAGRRRYVTRNAVAMIHQIGWEMGWQPSSNLAKNARFIETLNEQLTAFLSGRTGQPKEKIAQDGVEDFYLFGEDIIKYGLADEFWREETPSPPKRRKRRR